MSDIRHLLRIKSSPKTIYEALTTQEGIASWWSKFVEARPETGSIIHIHWGGEYHKDIRVVELIPERRIVWEIVHAHPEWIDTKVIFEISGGEEAELRFNHTGWKEYTDML